VTEPTEPTRPAEPIDPELLRRRQEAQLADWTARKAAELEVYKADQQALDVPEPVTIRQRLAHARKLVESGLVPAGWTGAKPGTVLTDRQLDKAAAGMVLAEQWGRHLGFQGMAALQHLQVVEGHVGVKPASARGMILAAGCELDDEVQRSAAGFPVAHTVTITRPGGRPKSCTFTLGDALQAGLISEIRTDAAGDVIGVTARSERNNPLPWESYTKAMLRHRATAEMVSSYAMDITGGMDLAPEMEEPAPVAPARVQARREAVAETVQRVTGEPAEPEPYDPAADLALIEETTGQADPPPWWEHADARERLGVRKRSKLQMAADRVKAWIEGHPAEAEHLMPHPADLEPVDAEIVDDPPADLMGTDATPLDEPATVAPFRDAEMAGPLPGVDDVPLPGMGATDPFDPHGDIAAEDQPSPPTAADLLAVLGALAEAEGKTLAQYLRREIAGLRANPEAWTLDQLATVVKARSGATDADLGM
jgi:hypothetical protein